MKQLYYGYIKKMFMLRENLKITFLLHSQDYQARAETHY